LALACATLALAAISTLPSFAILLALLFLWGASAGVIMAEGRTIVQMAAPASHRSRILALYQLGIMGGAPLGAPVIGAIARTWGPTAAMWVAAGCMSCVVALVATRSSVWRDEARADRPA
jgi:predicted MFS family arabinose efflux permease